MSGRRLPATLRLTFRSLKVRNYRFYFGAMLISAVGRWMDQIALVWLVLEVGGSGVSIGIASGLQFLPLLLFGTWTGLLADRLEKRRIVMFTQAIQALLAGTFALVVLTDVVTLTLIYALSACVGLVQALDQPVKRSLIVELVGRDELSNAVSLFSTQGSAARTVGPTIAGLLIAHFGTWIVFSLNGLLVLTAVGLIALVDPAAMHRETVVPRRSGQIREGLAYAWRAPKLRAPLIMVAVIGTLVFEWQVTMPLLVRETFSGGAQSLGFMMGLLSAGSFVGAVLTASRPALGMRYLVGSAFGLGGAILLGALMPTLVPFMVVLPLAGCAGAAFISASSAFVQVNTREGMVGRTTALLTILFVGSTAVGGPLVGWIASVSNPRVAYAVGGAAAVGAALFAGRKMSRTEARASSDS